MNRLVIRAEQMRAFQDALLCRWLEQFLRTNYPAQCAGTRADEFQEFLSIQIRRARQYGFLTDNQIRNYAHIAFLLGGDFDRNPDYEWALAILVERTVPADRRIRALQEAVLRHLDTAHQDSARAAAGA